MRRVNGELAVSNEAVDFATAMLVNNDEVDKLARPGVAERFQASHEHDADERARAESELLRVAIRQAIAEEEQKLKEEAKSKRRRRKLAPPVEVDAARRKEIEREVREAFPGQMGVHRRQAASPRSITGREDSFGVRADTEPEASAIAASSDCPPAAG